MGTSASAATSCSLLITPPFLTAIVRALVILPWPVAAPTESMYSSERTAQAFSVLLLWSAQMRLANMSRMDAIQTAMPTALSLARPTVRTT